MAAREAFQFAGAHVLGLANAATVCSTIGYTYNRALPGHPHGKRFDFIECHVRTVANAALGPATVDVILHAIAREGFNTAAVDWYRRIDHDRTLVLSQNLPHILPQVSF